MHIRNFFKREIDWEDELFAHCNKITEKGKKQIFGGKIQKSLNFEMNVILQSDTFSHILTTV